MDVQIILILLVTGSITGFIAGLLGIGGGLIVIPVTLWVAHWLNFPMEHIQHIAVGTSFGVMIFTTFISMVMQQKRKAVNWKITRLMVIGSISGALLGSSAAAYISGKKLQILFVVFCYAVAVKTLAGKKIKKHAVTPKNPVLLGYGGFVGFISGMLGIGGGVLNVPFLLYHNISVEKAVGISSAISFFIGLFGFIGYSYSGWSVSGLPPYSFGYCNIPIAVCLTITGMVFAPLGVKISHRMPKRILQILFALFVFVVANQIFYKWLNWYVF